jgi:hypothetical protein
MGIVRIEMATRKRNPRRAETEIVTVESLKP